MAKKKLSSKSNYVPKYMVQSVEVENKGKTTDIDGADIYDGFYVKKGVKFATGGSLEDKLTEEILGKAQYHANGIPPKRHKYSVRHNGKAYTSNDVGDLVDMVLADIKKSKNKKFGNGGGTAISSENGGYTVGTNADFNSNQYQPDVDLQLMKRGGGVGGGKKEPRYVVKKNVNRSPNPLYNEGEWVIYDNRFEVSLYHGTKKQMEELVKPYLASSEAIDKLESITTKKGYSDDKLAKKLLKEIEISEGLAHDIIDKYKFAKDYTTFFIKRKSSEPAKSVSINKTEGDINKVANWLLDNSDYYASRMEEGEDEDYLFEVAQEEAEEMSDDEFQEILKQTSKKYAKGGGLKKKANYVPRYMVQSVEVERKGKTTDIDGADILDGFYVKKGVKFATGGGVEIDKFQKATIIPKIQELHKGELPERLKYNNLVKLSVNDLKKMYMDMGGEKKALGGFLLGVGVGVAGKYAYDKYGKKLQGKGTKKGKRKKYGTGGGVGNDDTPKVWIGEWSLYNEGKLIGEWVDLSDYSSGEEVMDKIQELLDKWTEETGDTREEYGVFDFENFPRSMYSEQMGEQEFDNVIKAWEFSQERDVPMEVIGSIVSEYSPSDIGEWFDEHYEGQFDSNSDLAYHYVDMVGGLQGLGKETVERYFDYDSFGRDLAYDYTEFDGHYFRTYKRGGTVGKFDLTNYLTKGGFNYTIGGL